MSKSLYIGDIKDLNKLSENDLQNVTTIDFGGKSLKEIPEKVFFCKKLQTLLLHKNKISKIPLAIEELKELEFVIFSDNLIESLPYSIINLTKLNTIALNNNLLKSIPFSLIKIKSLKNVFIDNNPFEDDLGFASLLKSLKIDTSNNSELGEVTLNVLQYIHKFVFKEIDKSNKKFFTLQIEKELQTPVLHYLLFFKDYVKGAKKKDIHFEVERKGADALTLVTNGRNEVSVEEIREYFEEYVDLTRTKMDDWVLNVDASVTRNEGDILRLKLENEVGRFKNAYKIAQLENHRLKDELDFLRRLSLNFSERPITLNLKLPEKTSSFNPNQLLKDLRDKAIRLLERKFTKKLEDLHNDEFTDFLRDKGYSISDQSRSGRANLTAGEVDIMVRSENGTPVSIIEAFRLDSCGADNKIVGSHLDKLLHDYDTVGHTTNFVLVYAEAKNFMQLWENYQLYMNNLNKKESFRGDYPLLGFKETGISNKADLKIGLATHERNGQLVEVYHLFVNMSL